MSLAGVMEPLTQDSEDYDYLHPPARQSPHPPTTNPTPVTSTPPRHLSMTPAG